MVMIDIDHFKHYNDTNGHLLGNVILEQLAKLLKDNIRNIDQSYRFGGEEFSLIFMNVTPAEAYQLAENIRILVEQTVFPNQQLQPSGNLTISLGVSHTDLIDEHTPDAILHTSDQALYLAKSNGKNNTVLYQKEVSS
jgi:diguanylate cyclase (GGDEF)-like protein